MHKSPRPGLIRAYLADIATIAACVVITLSPLFL